MPLNPKLTYLPARLASKLSPYPARTGSTPPPLLSRSGHLALMFLTALVRLISRRFPLRPRRVTAVHHLVLLLVLATQWLWMVFTPLVSAATTQFDVSSVLNADVVVNRVGGVTDPSQLPVDLVEWSFPTQSAANFHFPPGPTGLPDNGFFAANAFHPDVQLILNNSDNGNNARRIQQETTSFTFNVPSGNYEQVHIFATAGNGDAFFRLRFNYNNGNVTTSALTVPDWFNSIGETTSRYYLIDGRDRIRPDASGYENANNPAIFGFRFDPDPTRVLQSITVEPLFVPGTFVFFGAAGVPPADLQVSKTNNINGVGAVGVPFTWTLTLSNTGNSAANFTNGQTFLTDNLPTSGASYGTPVVQNAVNVTNSNNIQCTITSNTLNCRANGATVSLGASTGLVEVAIPVTPTAGGTLQNPRGGGICRVDPGTLVVEGNESNNNCNNTVTVPPPDLQVSKENNTSGLGIVGVPFTWRLIISNTGGVAASFTNGQTLLTDNLPTTGASYGTPVVQNVVNVTNSGNIQCAIGGSTLNCTVNGAPVNLGAATGRFEVAIPVTPTAAGTLQNPRSGGICRVDPNSVETEGNELNNNCNINTVTVPPQEMAVLGNGQVITDNDATPSTTDDTDFGSVLAANGAVTHTFTISNSGGAALTLTGIPLVSITGPAAGDFTVVAVPTTPVAGGSTTTFQVRFDPSAVGTRSATLSIANNDTNENPYNFAVQGTGTIPTIQFTQAGPYSDNEDVGTSNSLALSRSGDTSFTSTVQVSLTGGSASGGSVDYTSSGFPLTVTFGPGETSQIVSIPIVDDLLDENTEDITLQVSATSNAVIGAVNAATLQIVDNDNPPNATIDDITVTEGTGGTVAAVFTVNLSAPSGLPVGIDYATANGTAIAPADYTAISTSTLNFAPGVTTQTVTVTVQSDALDEVDETFLVNLDNGANVAIADNQGIGTITDDDNPPDITLTLNGSPLAENGGEATLMAELSALSGRSVTVNLGFSGTATTISDYTASSAFIIIPVGNLTGAITLTAQDDSLDENDETIVVDIETVVNGTESGTQQVTAIIADDDAAPSLSIDNVSADEAGGIASFTVNLNALSGLDVSVDYSTANGTAVAGSDYTALSTATLTIPAGNLTGTITVNLTDDALDEDNETFLVNLGNPINATISDDQGLGTILDDDALPILTINDVGVGEAAGSTNFTFSLNTISGRDVSLNYSTLDGTASSGSDYTGLPATALIIPAGNLTATVTVAILDDFVDESDETFFVSLSNGVNVTIGDNLGQGTILDNDTAGITVVPTSLTIGEPSGSADFTIALTSEPTATITINLNSSDPTECAVPASVNLTSLTWQAGVSVTVTVVDDQISDGPQPCTVQTTANSSDPNYDGQPVDDVDVTVTDDDLRGVTISADEVSIEEGGATAQYTIQLDTIPTDTVTIAFNTGGQLDGITSLTFLADPTALDPQTVIVTATDDPNVEGDHSGLISHTASGGGYTGFSIANVSAAITDNDIAYTLAANQASVGEGNNGATAIGYTLTRTGDITRSSTIDFNLGGTASSGADYNNVAPAPGGLTFNAGQTSLDITLDVLGDFIVEGNETISLNLSNATGTNGSGTGIISGSPATTTILDDDSAEIIVSPASLTIAEPSGTDIFNIRLTSEPTATVTINLSSNDLTECTAPVSASLDASNWQAGLNVTVTAVDDLIADGSQLCQINTAAASSSDSNYAGRDSQNVDVTVQDNDTPGITVTPTEGLTTTETGNPATFTMRLNTEPTATVTIALVSLDTTEGAVSPANLTFSQLDWNVPQTVTVTGVNDDEDDGNVAYTIQTGPTTSSDATYNNSDPADVNLTNLDDDTAGFIVSTISSNTDESGLPATFTIRLTSQPTAEVTVPIASSDLTEGAVSPASLTFSPLDWNVPQIVTVTGVDDPDLDGDIAYTILTDLVTSSADPLYTKQAPVNVAVVNLDNEALAPAASPIYLPIIMGPRGGLPDLVVDSLSANGSNVSVTIRNAGNAPVVDAFWVDVYLNPATPPTHVNQRWQDVGTQGLVWGVKGEALPLEPGETLTLTRGDSYYFANLSNFTTPLAPGSSVYAQVDSVNQLTNYGGVRESHEFNGGSYNNIIKIITEAGVTPATTNTEALSDNIAGLPLR